MEGQRKAKKKWRWEKHLQTSFQSIIISRVLDMSEAAQFCCSYHYHHSYNHNQGNSCVARWKGGWQRVMEEYEMSDWRNKDIMGCNTHTDMDAGGGGRGVQKIKGLVKWMVAPANWMRRIQLPQSQTLFITSFFWTQYNNSIMMKEWNNFVFLMDKQHQTWMRKLINIDVSK